MKSKSLVSLMAGMALILFFVNTGNATGPVSGEEALFVSSTQPDALLVVDLSGSMDWNPAGDDLTYGSNSACYADTTNCKGTGCSGGFCQNSKAATTFFAHTSDCTADSTNCVGTNCSRGFCSAAKVATIYYSSNVSGTADYANCRGTGCGRSDGFCTASMPAGTTYYAHDSSCTANTYHCRYSESWKDCANGFCATSHSSYTRQCSYACTTTACSTPLTTTSCDVACSSGACSQACSRLDITKRSIFNILDDNADGSISTADEGSLGVRLGYMRFNNCSSDDTGGAYSSGCNKLIKAIGTNYSTINSYVQAESASGGTPLATSLKEAKLYLDAHKANDASKNCRQKFVILITDGSDTYACGGDGSECDPHRYKNRREVVAKAKALNDAGYKVFVIGFGTAMPPYLRNALNWAAYYGGTDNPNEANSGDTTAYSIATATDCTATSPANTAACCNLNSAGCYPSGVSGCTNDSSSLTASCYDASKPYPTTSGNSQSNFQATANDPGYLTLSGYAYLAGNANELVAAVKASINIIREATFSFSQASIQSSRTTDENYVYEGSFQPVAGDPFWLGHLRKYPINTDGTVSNTFIDAGSVLKATTYSSRNIKTCIGCSATYISPISPSDFSTSIDKTYFDVSTDAERDAIVGYIQGNPAYNPENWKLGDVFRSTPITFGSPSFFFEDMRDKASYTLSCTGGLNCATTSTQTVNAFGYHRCTHCRSSSNYKRLIVAGANDGQFHAFRTNDMVEVWSFIPPNLLSKLKNITHSTHPSSLVHQYFVDGPVSGADVWLGSGNGKNKSSSDWKSVLVFGLGRGSTEHLWSSSAYCDSGLAGTYSPTYSNYCGYYALDLTDSINPKYMWRLNGFDAGTQAPYMGDSWSKMMMGRILLKSGATETEKWVGFIGGGYNENDCTGGGTCDKRGKGFFIVDLSNGQILWSFTLGAGTASTTGSGSYTDMKYSLPAPPAIVDTDNDGFVDTVYIGDMGGNMWRFKLCTKSMLNAGSCSTSNWNGRLLFDSSSGNIRPIFTSAAVTKDPIGNIWVYWGTGDKIDPTAANAQEHFYAMKDNFTSTYTVNDIDTLSSDSQVFNPASTTKVGYRIQLNGSGQKILAEPTIFGGVVYYTSFTPGNSSDPCEQAGTATLSCVSYTTGAGACGDSNIRSMTVGTGIASAPIVSIKPGGGTGTGGSIADLYVTVSGGGLTSASTLKVNMNVKGVSNMTNMLFWKDKRVK